MSGFAVLKEDAGRQNAHGPFPPTPIMALIGKPTKATRRARSAIDFSPRGIRACIAFRNSKTQVTFHRNGISQKYFAGNIK